MGGWRAFRTGIARTLRYRWVLLALFAANLLCGLLLTALPALSLVGGLGHQPTIRQVADGIDAWMVIETMMSPVTEQALMGDGEPQLSPGLQEGVLLTLIVGPLILLFSSLSSTFLGGGALLTFVEAPESFRWRRFLWGCWHWFGAFLLLSVVQQGASLFLVGLFITLATLIAAAIGGWVMWLLLPLLALGIVIWLALMETTRVAAVAGETRNIARAFGRAVTFLFHRFPSLMALYGLALLLLLLIHGLYRFLKPFLPLEMWLLMLLVGEVFILARLGARIARLAGAVTLYQGGTFQERKEEPSD